MIGKKLLSRGTLRNCANQFQEAVENSKSFTNEELHLINDCGAVLELLDCLPDSNDVIRIVQAEKDHYSSATSKIRRKHF